MASQKWSGSSGSYLDPAQWTPPGIPLYGADTIALIDAGTVLLSNAEPDGITLILGGATNPELVLDNAALGSSMTLETTGAATLGVRGYDTNYGQITLGGALAIDTGGYGQFNQFGTITVPTGSALSVGATGVLNNGGLIDFTGGVGTIDDRIEGNGTIDLAAASSSLTVAAAAGADETFALDQGSLRIDNFGTFKGKLADFNSIAASLTLGQVRFDSAAYVTLFGTPTLVLISNSQTVGQIALTNTPFTNYAVNANSDGTSTITPVAIPPTRTFSDGSIPSVIDSGVVVIKNAEPNGQLIRLGSTNAAGQPTLVLDNAALGPQLTLSLLSPAGIAFFSYATLEVQGYDTTYGTILLGGRPLTPEFLTVTLGPHAQLNQSGIVDVSDGSGMTIRNADANAPGTLNNTGLISLAGGNAVITPDIVGYGTIKMNFISNVGSSSLELGGAVAPSQIIEINDGRLQLDKPSLFMGDIYNFEGPVSSLVLENTRADAAQFLPGAGGSARLLLTNMGTEVDRFLLHGGMSMTRLYDVSYDAASNATTVRSHLST